jgi:hypothetical protein
MSTTRPRTLPRGNVRWTLDTGLLDRSGDEWLTISSVASLSALSNTLTAASVRL